MQEAVTKLARLPFIALVVCATASSVIGDVVINEFVAASSDRNVKWSEDGQPTVGTGVPWADVAFDDSAWRVGPGGLGFGGGDDATDVGAIMQGKAVSLYIRRAFVVSASDAARADPLRLTVDYDDGFVAFLNGKEVARKNLGPANAFAYHDQHAYNGHSPGTPESFTLAAASELLTAGTNVLAIQVHNIDIDDWGLSIIADLIITGTPEKELVNHTNHWRYFVGTHEPSGGLVDPWFLERPPLEVAWGAVGFDDGSWDQGPGGIGYGDGDDGTDVEAQMRYIAYSLYTRQGFVVSTQTASRVDSLKFTVDYDDGFIAYLNGVEVARRNLGAVGEFAPCNQSAHTWHEAGAPETIFLGPASEFLTPGTNVFAVQTHNATIDSSDLSMIADLSLTGAPPVKLVIYSNIWRYYIGTDEPCPPPEDGDAENIDDDFIDWIELYNNGATSISLSGWALTDDAGNSNKWIFPDVSLGPAEYVIVFCTGASSTSRPSESLRANFKLDKEGEYLVLLDNANPRQIVSEFTPQYPPQSFFHSYGWNQSSGAFCYFETATPGMENAGPVCEGMVAAPVFDVAPGFYDSSVDVGITVSTTGAVVRYTTDGTEPTTNNGTLYSGSLHLTSSAALRARAFKDGWIPSPTVTRTYLLNQPDMVKKVPAISLVGDPDRTLFKPNGATAIVGGYWDGYGVWHANSADDYNIAMPRGRPYERPASIEVLYAGTDTWVQIDCGIRTAGSDYSRPRFIYQDLTGLWDEFPFVNKPHFNVFFRGDYGSATLDFPLMPDSRVTTFDSLRMRSGHNDWINPFIIDELVRRLFIDTGQPCSRGFIGYLFVNSEFKAYFNPVERMDERFFQEWHDSDYDWDIINHGGVSEGDSAAWNALLAFLGNHDLSVLGNYQVAAQMVDTVNFIDYLLVECYGANWDWPNNNWYTARERSDEGTFRFYVWDAEGCFFNSGINGVNKDSFNENPVWQPGGGQGLNGENTPVANIYRELKDSPEFRLLFADRIQKHYFCNGSLTEAHITQRCLELDNVMQEQYEFYFPWSGPYDTSIRNIWIPNRRPYIFAQFANENLWPSVSAPVFNQHGGTVTNGFEVALTHTNGSGTIYYTIDGTDPRNPGGSVGGTAYAGPFTVTRSTCVKARVHSGGVWSPLSEATFTVTGAAEFVVSEIMYHPSDGSEYEFIELRNVSGAALDVSEVSIVDGIAFSFGGSAVTSLAAEAYVVVVKSNAAFASLYVTNNILIAGEYEGKLDNAGERIELQGASNLTLLAFTYDDAWYPQTDGGGYSLVIINPFADLTMWDEKAGWRQSYFVNGSPGTADVPEPFVWCAVLLAFLVIRDGWTGARND